VSVSHQQNTFLWGYSSTEFRINCNFYSLVKKFCELLVLVKASSDPVVNYVVVGDRHYKRYMAVRSLMGVIGLLSAKGSGAENQLVYVYHEFVWFV
jgi:hypothetical protein